MGRGEHWQGECQGTWGSTRAHGGVPGHVGEYQGTWGSTRAREAEYAGRQRAKASAVIPWLSWPWLWALGFLTSANVCVLVSTNLATVFFAVQSKPHSIRKNP